MKDYKYQTDLISLPFKKDHSTKLEDDKLDRTELKPGKSVIKYGVAQSRDRDMRS